MPPVEHGERLATLEAQMDQVLAGIRRLETHVEGLRLWKASLLGFGAMIGSLISAGIQWLRH